MDRINFVNGIELLDPNHETVNINLSNNTIKYSDEIIQHRTINLITGDEELVRAYFVVKLVSELGYKKNDIELEKEYQAGRPKSIKPRIDILLRERNDQKVTTFLFIEVKSPDKFDKDKEYIQSQLFELSKLEDKKYPINYLVYCTANLKGGIIKENNIIIDYKQYPDYALWEEKGKLALDKLPKDYGEAKKVKYIKGMLDLDTKVSKTTFDALRRDLHDVVWGGGGTNYNEIFINLVKIFLAKIYDENNTNNNQSYQFQIEYKGKIPETAEELYNRINDLYIKGCKNYLGYSKEELSNEAINKRSISPNKVRYVVEQLQSVSLTKNETNHHDILGDFFEAIVTQGFKQDKGQFFTPLNIVRFIIYALGIDDGAIYKVNKYKTLPFIVDPAVGSGTFLIEAMKIITETVKRRRRNELSTSNDVKLFVNYKMPDIKENSWAWDYLYGVEINPDLALATKVNMVLHGDGSGNIYAKDALLPFNKYENKIKVSILSKSKSIQNYSYKKDTNEQFDYVISNPPFSIKLDPETKRLLPQTFIYADTGSSENLFIERWYQLLKENGKLGVVLPESVFDTAENLYIRLFIYKYFKIKFVISLPSGKNGAFLPYTPIKTSLLFLQKKSKEDVLKYEKEWRDASNKYNQLKRKVKNIQESKISELEKSEILKEYLQPYLSGKIRKLNFNELINIHGENINEINKNSDWWIFSLVSKKVDYKILFAHAKSLGYHRTKNRYFKRENELYSVDSDENVIVNNQNPKKILDYIKTNKDYHSPSMFYLNFSDLSKSINLRLDHRFYRYKFFEEPKILLSFKKKPFFFREAIIGIRNGKDVERDNYSVDANGLVIETRFKYITVNNIKPDGFVFDEVINLMTKKGEELAKFALEKNEIIITRSGTVGVSKVVDIDFNNIIFIPSGYLIIVKLDENKLIPEFIEFYLNSYIMRKYFQVFGTGKTQKNISQPDIKRIPIPNLTKIEQMKIVEEYKRQREILNKKIKQKQMEILDISNKRNEIIPSFILSKKIELELEEDID